jgi:hypothetical protein
VVELFQYPTMCWMSSFSTSRTVIADGIFFF